MMKNANTLKGTSQGLALTIVLVLMLLVSLVGAGILILANSHYKLTQHLINSTKTFYLTEAGIHWAINRIRTTADPSYNSVDGTDPPVYFEGTYINITINAIAAPEYTINAITDSSTSPGNVVRRIRVIVNRPPPFTPPNPVTIDNWQEI